MKRIALASCAKWPELTKDDRLLILALQQFEVEAVPAIWDGAVDWTTFDQVVIRSCWDYHLRPAEFLRWLDSVEHAGVAIQNAPELIRWNADKRYLRELSTAGVPIPPTIWIEDGKELSSSDLLESLGWSSAVVKPTIGASAYSLSRVFKDDGAVQLKGPLLLQQFIPEIVSEGEWSLVFISGEFSHAVVKRAAAGDFRVQSEFGGRTTSAKPRDQMIEEATRILALLPGKPLYARIDGVDCDGKFVLMEVELIEPDLFLGPGNAAHRLAKDIAGLVHRQRA